MRIPVRIALRGHEQRGEDFVLTFSVDEGAGEMTATVQVSQSGTVRFPHHMCSTGGSFGPTIDAALVDRAAQTVAMMQAAEAWGTMRRHRRRP